MVYYSRQNDSIAKDIWETTQSGVMDYIDVSNFICSQIVPFCPLILELFCFSLSLNTHVGTFFINLLKTLLSGQALIPSWIWAADT